MMEMLSGRAVRCGTAIGRVEGGACSAADARSVGVETPGGGGVRHIDGVRSCALYREWQRKRLRHELRFYTGTIAKNHPPDADADLSQRKHRRDHAYDSEHFRIDAVAGRRFEKEDH